MEQEIDAEVEVGQDGAKRIVSAGVSYPFESLSDSLATIDKLVSENGTSIVITKEDISRVTGKKQNTLVMYFSTYQQYGILGKVHGKGFLPTDLYKKYKENIYPNHEREALLEMFKRPALYSKIIDNLNNANLPSEEKFPSLLKSDPYNVNVNSAERASRIFFENARFLKVIDSNNKLIYSTTVKSDHIDHPKDTHQKPQDSKPPLDESMFELPIPLGNGRKAYLKYPIGDLKPKDIKVIAKALSFIASSISSDDDDDAIEIIVKENKKEQS